MLHEALYNLKESPRPKSTCLVRTILNGLSELNRDALLAVLATPTVSNASISKVLAEHGTIASASVISKHRRGDCSCDVAK